MRIPTKTKMIRNRKDSSPSSSCNENCEFLQINQNQSISSNSTNCSNSSSTSSSAISLLREDLCVEEEFSIDKTLNEGSFSSVCKIILATLKKDTSRSKVVIKARPVMSTTIEDFNREVELTYLLSPHPNVVTCYNVTFHWNGSLCFLQEYAKYGSLHRLLYRRRYSNHRTSSGALGEHKTKLVCAQITSALEFMHQLHLVHGQVTPNNVLVFNGNLTQVKLCDFSSTRAEGSLVVVKESKSSNCIFNPNPPELSELLPQEKYHVQSGLDSWQLGIMTYFLLQGKGPWTEADALQDPGYRSYLAWLKRKNLKVPESLRNCSPRFRRMFKRLCEPKQGQRSGVRELRKYLKDAWLITKTGGQGLGLGGRRTSDDISTESTTVPVHSQTEQQSPEDTQDHVTNSLQQLSLVVSLEIDKTKNLEDWIHRHRSTSTSSQKCFM